jgi:hypothetical protein
MTARPAFRPHQQHPLHPFIFCNGGEAVGLLQGERGAVLLRDAQVYGPDPLQRVPSKLGFKRHI